jgi:hypothetical protein
LQQLQREKAHEVRQAKKSLGLVKRDAELALSKMQIEFEQQRQAMQRQMVERERALVLQVEAMKQDTEKQLRERSAQLDADHAKEVQAWRARSDEDKAHHVSKHTPILSLNVANSNKGKGGTRTCSWTRKAEAG